MPCWNLQAWSIPGSSKIACTPLHFVRNQFRVVVARQKRNYYVRARGKHFKAEDLVWVHNPQWKKGMRPKLDNEWMGPLESESGHASGQVGTLQEFSLLQ